MNKIIISVLSIVMLAGALYATPSTTFWTPCTTYIQPFGVPHITYDNYFTGSGFFPADLGFYLLKRFRQRRALTCSHPGVIPFNLTQRQEFLKMPFLITSRRLILEYLESE